MSKKNKMIVAILGVILILVIVIIILLGKGKDTNNSELIGTYSTGSWNNSRYAELKLNDDMTCQYPLSNYICKWSKTSDYVITIELSQYNIKYSDTSKNENKPINDRPYYYQNECEEDRLNKWKDNTNSLKCVIELNEKVNAEIIENGILLNNHIFTKKQGNK